MYTVTPVIITKGSPCGTRPDRVTTIDTLVPESTLTGARREAAAWMSRSGQTNYVEIRRGGVFVEVLYPQD